MNNPFDEIFGDYGSQEAICGMYSCAAYLKKTKEQFFCGTQFSEEKAELLKALNMAMTAIETALYAVVIGNAVNKIAQIAKQIEEDNDDEMD